MKAHHWWLVSVLCYSWSFLSMMNRFYEDPKQYMLAVPLILLSIVVTLCAFLDARNRFNYLGRLLK